MFTFDSESGSAAGATGGSSDGGSSPFEFDSESASASRTGFGSSDGEGADSVPPPVEVRQGAVQRFVRQGEFQLRGIERVNIVVIVIEGRAVAEGKRLLGDRP